jgi:hypothetical protein
MSITAKDKAKLDVENIRGLDVEAVRPSTAQVTDLQL